MINIESFSTLKLLTFDNTQAPGAANFLSKSLLKEYSKSLAITLLPFPFLNSLSS